MDGTDYYYERESPSLNRGPDEFVLLLLVLGLVTTLAWIAQN